MRINSILSLVVASLAVATFTFPSTGLGAGFEFDLEGDGEGVFEFEVNETISTTNFTKANFEFNGGAGTQGNAWADGQFSAVGGFYLEDAGGAGNAFSDTALGNYANASFASSSYGVNGGVAADWGSGLSNIGHFGLIQAGGAGSAGTGITIGSTESWLLDGGFAYEIDADGEASFGFTP